MFPRAYFGPAYWPAAYWPGPPVPEAGGDGTTTDGDLRAALYSILSADPAVSSLAAGRVRPGFRPQADGSAAALAVRVVADSGGGLLAESAASWARVQVDCTGPDLESAAALARRCRNILRGLRRTAAGVVVSAASKVGEQDMHEWADDGTDAHVYRIVLDFRVRYRILNNYA